MELSFIPDNITEVLAKIVQFTELRRGILNGNVRGLRARGYMPRDLPVVEFADLLNVAISEHLQHHRLLFRDTDNITFGDGGTMRIHPIADEHAQALLQTNPDAYLNLQTSRLFENSLNGRVAKELMQRHSGTVCGLPDTTADDDAVATDAFPEDRHRAPLQRSERSYHSGIMRDQAVNLHLSEARSPLARVLAITSGKGGVGKTNIAANLAICLAGMRERVLLLDADMSLANVNVVMNIRSKYDISHVLSGHKRMEDIIQSGPSGVRVICGASGLDKLADLSEGEQRHLLHHLSKLQQESDTIVVDTAAGISRSVVNFCLAADHVLVVTTPESTAMTDAYGMIKVLARKRYEGPISIVVNMARDLTEGKRTYQRIADVARKFLSRDLYFAAVLPKDERLCTAVRSRIPVVLAYPNAQISSSLAKLASRLSDVRRDGNASGGFFRKVVKWLN